MYYTALSLQPDAHEVCQDKQDDHSFETATTYKASIPLFKLLGFGFLGFGWSAPSYSQDTNGSKNAVVDHDEANLA